VAHRVGRLQLERIQQVVVVEREVQDIIDVLDAVGFAEPWV
jgi:hypothetical protein